MTRPPPGSFPTVLDDSSGQGSPGRDGVTFIDDDAGGRGVPQPAILNGAGSVDGYRLMQRLPDTSHAEFWLVAAPDNVAALLKVHRVPAPARHDTLRLLGNMRHEGLVRVIAHGVVGAHDYEVQEYLPHGSLAQWHARNPGPVNPELVRDLVHQLWAALLVLHQHGLVHRDLKPANLLIRSSAPLRVAVADFDIARCSVHERHVTQLVQFTLEYAPPEAYRKVVSPAGDWWSLGVIVLELLLGRHPLDGLDDEADSAGPTKQRIESLDRFMTEYRFPIPNGLPAEWDLLLRGLLTKERARRWGASEVERWLAGDRDIPHAWVADPSEPSRSRVPYIFGRQRVEARTPADVAAAFRTDWVDAKAHLARRMLENWIDAEVRDQALHHDVVSIREDDSIPDLDWKLALAVVALDRSRPLVMPRFLFDAETGERVADPRQPRDEVADAQYDIVDDAWLATHPSEALKLVGTRTAWWHERLSGTSQLLEWAEQRGRWIDELRRLSPSTKPAAAARLLTRPAAELLAAADRKRGRYVAALDPQLELLRGAAHLSVPGAIMLLLAPPDRFHTAEQALAASRRRAVHATGVPVDPVVLERLLAGEVSP